MIKYARMAFFGVRHILSDYGKIRQYAKHPEKFPLSVRYAKVRSFFLKLNRSSFHVDFYVQGEENVPDGQCLFVGNHVSVYDPIAFVQYFERPLGFVAKKEIRKMPLVPTIAKAIDSTLLDREDLRSEILAFSHIDKLLQDNPDLSYVIYPEGTRSRKPPYELLDFHPGSFKLATRRNIPIVPYAMFLTDRVLNQKYHYRRYPLQLLFLKPILPSEFENMDTQEIAKLARERVQEGLAKLRAADIESIQKSNKYSLTKAKKVQFR